MTAPNREDLVGAVRTECRVCQLRRLRRVHFDRHHFAGVAHHGFSARPAGRQRDRERRGHPAGLLSVAVFGEEPARLADEQLVELSLEPSRGTADAGRHLVQDAGQRPFPPATPRRIRPAPRRSGGSCEPRYRGSSPSPSPAARALMAREGRGPARGTPGEGECPPKPPPPRWAWARRGARGNGSFPGGRSRGGATGAAPDPWRRGCRTRTSDASGRAVTCGRPGRRRSMRPDRPAATVPTLAATCTSGPAATVAAGPACPSVGRVSGGRSTTARRSPPPAPVR